MYVLYGFKNFKELTKIHWSDITFPYINLGKGKRILTFFYQLFGSVQLEDTWIPICCVTTSLTSQDVRVDRSGNDDPKEKFTSHFAPEILK